VCVKCVYERERERERERIFEASAFFFFLFEAEPVFNETSGRTDGTTVGQFVVRLSVRS